MEYINVGSLFDFKCDLF